MTNQQQPAVNPETEELLTRVYRLRDGLHYEVRDGIVFVIIEQNAWIQRVLRKIHYKIPETSEMELDKYGSFILQQIDGKRTVKEIGENLGAAIEEANDQLYDRLLIYLNHLEKNEKYIELV
ncbi:PqqD family protein [Enterococcus gilvus]|uniref:PqqD family protein n=1 Tax=Enterococcus gilvus TaxID=160453 RepID=UPI0028D8D1D3|nr:PqqD family protein [Enterococcus gilvus]